MNELNTFSNFSGLKFNKTKFAIASIGVLNGLQMELCALKCVNFNNQTMKILRVHLLYHKNLEQVKMREHFKIMAHETVNVRRKNYSL